MNSNDFDRNRILGRWTYQQDPNLVATLVAHTTTHLRGVLQRALGHTDDWLFDQAEKAGPLAGARHMEDLRALRSARPHLEKCVERHIEDGFRALVRQVQPETHGSQTLSLVEEDQLDVQLASEMVVEALARVHGPALDAIEKRFAVLVGAAKLEPSLNPLSAARLGNSLRQAQSEIAISGDVRVILYKYFERDLIQGLEPLLSEFNARLASAGLLPELGLPKPTEAVTPASSASTATAAAARPRAETAADDQDVFNALCDLLHTWRPQSGERTFAASGAAPGSAQTGGRRPMAMPEMMSVLSLLQPRVPDSVVAAMANREASLSALLKKELIDSAANIGLPPGEIRMSQDDEDAVDLVGMLFDVMFDERDFEQLSRTLMSKLVVPYVKVALLDRQMFLLKHHPARRLLNSMAEACEGNRGEGPQERELLQKAESTTERLVADFNEDIAIFETLEQELRAFLDQHRRRVELSERRAAEAQRGQERLEQARELAARELQQRVQGATLTPALSDFLERYWTHHLSMIALREGPETASWQAAMGVAESLVALLPRDGKAARQVASSLFNLREPIEAVLASSGVTGQSAGETLRVLMESLEAAGRGLPQPAPMVAAAPVPEARPALAVVGGKDSLDFDPADLVPIRELKVGAWIDVAGEDGKMHPAKLSWISPISSRLMFVNRRGVRVLVASAEELAAQMRTGRVALRERENVFDQVLHRVMDRLKTDVKA